jgi:hypothetical protein
VSNSQPPRTVLCHVLSADQEFGGKDPRAYRARRRPGERLQLLSLGPHLPGLNLAKISPEEIAFNRKGSSSDPKADAAVRFAAEVAETWSRQGRRSRGGSQGWLQRRSVARDRRHRRGNVIADFVNEVAKSDIDFPVVQANDLRTA